MIPILHVPSCPKSSCDLSRGRSVPPLYQPHKNQHRIYANKTDRGGRGCSVLCFMPIYPSLFSLEKQFSVNVGPKSKDQNLPSNFERTLAPNRMAWPISLGESSGQQSHMVLDSFLLQVVGEGGC